MDNQTKKYSVKGLHCASCEVLIEKKILELKNVKSADASATKGELLITCENEKPGIESLNEIFKKDGYVFSDFPEQNQNEKKTNCRKEFSIALGAGLIIILIFIGLNKFGLTELAEVNKKTSLPMFFVFGLLAGISSCTALVGGMLLSLSKQWNEIYSANDSVWKKTQPQLLFNAGRIIAYVVFGVALGAIGNSFKLSLKFGPLLIIAISIMMIFLALQLFGLKTFRKIQFTLPKFITRFIANEANFKGRYLPFSMGALTFFLPCGFTLTAQGLALISGSAVQGALIMILFALGTLPALLFIGLSSVKFLQKPHLAEKFLKTAGILVLFFALYNINSQLNVLGAPSLNDLRVKPAQSTESIKNSNTENEKKWPLIVNGAQLIKMEASTSGYSPNYFKVKAGLPVRWEITDKGTSGCTNAVIARNLFDGEIRLSPGQTSVKEFTPEKPGKYKFSCWMGMISGIIEVTN